LKTGKDRIEKKRRFEGAQIKQGEITSITPFGRKGREGKKWKGKGFAIIPGVKHADYGKGEER